MSKQLEQYLSNPNVQAFLGMLRDAEATSNTDDPYRTRFGGEVDESLSYDAPPTFVAKSFKQTDGKQNKSTAVGAYQFLRGTWDGLVKQYGFEDFSPRTQDLAAIALLKQNGALPHILRGNFDVAVKKAGGTWASLPSSPHPQHTRSQSFVQQSLSKHLGQGVDLGKYEVTSTPKQQPLVDQQTSTSQGDNQVSQKPMNILQRILNKVLLLFRHKK